MTIMYWVRPVHDDTRFHPALERTTAPLQERLTLGRAMRSVEPVQEWAELEFTTSGVWADLPLALDVTLCSDRLRQLIDSHRSDRDLFEWLPSWALTSSGDRLRYWVLHFLERPDTLDRDASLLDREGDPIDPVLMASRLEGRAIVPDPGLYGTTFYVDRDLGRAILSSAFQGVAVDPQMVTNART